jgi:hypothetical protein
MAEVKHFDLGNAIVRVDKWHPDDCLTTIIQLDQPMGVVKMYKAQTAKLLDCLLELSGTRPALLDKTPEELVQELTKTRTKCENLERYLAEERELSAKNLRELEAAKEQLAQAQADNDLAQAEIARLTEKPKRTRKPKADEPPASWDEVSAEPRTDLGAQGHGDNVWTAGEWVEVIATGSRAQVDRIFPDNPSKVQVLLGGSLPKVFDVSALRRVEVAAPEPTDMLDVEELIEGLEAVGLPVITDVPTVAPSVPTIGTDEPEVVTTSFDAEKLRRALYEDSKLYEFTPEEMKALITEVLGTLKSTKEMDTAELSAVLREMHDRGRKARMPF